MSGQGQGGSLTNPVCMGPKIWESPGLRVWISFLSLITKDGKSKRLEEAGQKLYLI
jgi:hypothetical protein